MNVNCENGNHEFRVNMKPIDNKKTPRMEERGDCKNCDATYITIWALVPSKTLKTQVKKSKCTHTHMEMRSSNVENLDTGDWRQFKLVERLECLKCNYFLNIEYTCESHIQKGGEY